MMKKLRRDEPVEILGDGAIVRDYLYIDDFVSACLACIQFEKQQKRFRMFNVSSGQSLSINQLCDVIEEAIDVKSVILDYSMIKK